MNKHFLSSGWGTRIQSFTPIKQYLASATIADNQQLTVFTQALKKDNKGNLNLIMQHKEWHTDLFIRSSATSQEELTWLLNRPVYGDYSEIYRVEHKQSESKNKKKRCRANDEHSKNVKLA